MSCPGLMVIGLDSVSLSLLDHFSKHSPSIRRFMRRGFAGSAIPSFPMYTPTNWAVLCTGAESSTTGAEGWHSMASGKRLSTFDRRSITCDTIFDSAARAGLRTLAIAYPGAYPANSPRNMVLAPLDRGLVSNCLVPGRIVEVSLGESRGFRFTLLKQPETASGAALAKAVGATEDGEDSAGDRRKARAPDVEAVLTPAGAGTWRLSVTQHAKRADLTLTHEAWSEPIQVHVSSPHRPGRCLLRVMVFDRGRRLAVSEAYDVGLLGSPQPLARELLAALGPPIEHAVFQTAMQQLFRHGKEDRLITRLARRELEAQAGWIADAAAWVQERRPFDVFYLHFHYPDNVLHAYLAALDGLPAFTARQRRLARKAVAMCLEICDGLIGRLARLAGPGTTLLLVSDHGNATATYGCSIQERLAEEGLLKVNADGSVDRRHSLAWPADCAPGTWIDVNAAKGTPGYEELQAQVIDALLDWKSNDGRRVVALALRRKDAHVLGYYGPRCADVVFHYNSGFSWAGAPRGESVGAPPQGAANHGPQMPVTFSRSSDNMAFFVLCGPGVARGVRWNMETMGPIYLKDMVPTACGVSGVPAPRDACGVARLAVSVRRAGRVRRDASGALRRDRS